MACQPHGADPPDLEKEKFNMYTDKAPLHLMLILGLLFALTPGCNDDDTGANDPGDSDSDSDSGEDSRRERYVSPVPADQPGEEER